MKVISTSSYRKSVLSQKVYNPDSREFEEFNDVNYEFVEPDQDMDVLPVLGPDDLGKRIPITDDIKK